MLVIVEEGHNELDGDGDRYLRGPGRHGGHHGGGRFGYLTDAERVEMMLKHLTCMCCKEDDDEVENDSD